MSDDPVFLVCKSKQSAFELGEGNWDSLIKDGKLHENGILLQCLCVIATNENWQVRPAYILWLRDALMDFAENEDIELASEHPEGYELKTRFMLGAVFLNHISSVYEV